MMAFHPPLPPETLAEIVCAHGRESASAVALRLNVKRNTVLGAWSRANKARQKREALHGRPIERVVGLHGVSLPRLQSLEADRD